MADLDEVLGRIDMQLNGLLGKLEKELRRNDLHQLLPSTVQILSLIVDDTAYSLTRVQSNDLRQLSPREKEVAELLLCGLSRKAIASRLGISPRTVDTHIQRIYAKRGVRTRATLEKQLTQSL